MKREEALRIIKECKEKGFKHTFYTLNEYHTALDIAIKALEQEPCKDAISREDALMALTGEIKETDTIETIIARSGRRIKSLPSVNPQTRWIPVSERLSDDRNTTPVIVNWHETSPEPWMGKE